MNFLLRPSSALHSLNNVDQDESDMTLRMSSKFCMRSICFAIVYILVQISPESES
jgi:hypothetical protein